MARVLLLSLPHQGSKDARIGKLPQLLDGAPRPVTVCAATGKSVNLARKAMPGMGFADPENLFIEEIPEFHDDADPLARWTVFRRIIFRFAESDGTGIVLAPARTVRLGSSALMNGSTAVNWAQVDRNYHALPSPSYMVEVRVVDAWPAIQLDIASCEEVVWG